VWLNSQSETDATSSAVGKVDHGDSIQHNVSAAWLGFASSNAANPRSRKAARHSALAEGSVSSESQPDGLNVRILQPLVNVILYSGRSQSQVWWRVKQAVKRRAKKCAGVHTRRAVDLRTAG
jgi:hypothetical protein